MILLAPLLLLSFLLQGLYCLPTPNSHTMELYGNFTLGYYFANIFLGTPPQEQSFIIDTGSSVFAIPCDMCVSCGLRHLNPKFDVAKSTTNQLLTCETGGSYCQGCEGKPGNASCEFSTSYVEGSSLKGIMVEDMVMIQTQGNIQTQMSPQNSQNISQSSHSDSVKAVFGCITKETNLFLSQKADGILGLCPQQISNVLTEFKSNGKLNQSSPLSFSLCLAEDGGSFTFGGVNPTIQRQNPVILNYRDDYKHYSLIIDEVLVGGTRLNVSTLEVFYGSGVIIDSGSTFTYFPHHHYNYTLDVIDSVCKELNCKQFSGEDSKCYHFPSEENETLLSFEEQLDKFPTIELKFGIRRIGWTPRSYFLVRNEKKREACLSILGLNSWIFGITWLANREVHFDLDHNQVTISDAKCKPNEEIHKFRRMFQHDKSPLTDLLQYHPHSVLLALLMVSGVVILVFGVAIATVLVIKRRESLKQVQLAETDTLGSFEGMSEQEKREIVEEKIGTEREIETEGSINF